MFRAVPLSGAQSGSLVFRAVPLSGAQSGSLVLRAVLWCSEPLLSGVPQLEFERFSGVPQLEFERGQARRSEKDQQRLADQLDEERLQSQQVTSALTKECKWAGARALEEGLRLADAARRLDKVSSVTGTPSRPAVRKYTP